MSTNILDEYTPEAEFAADNGVHPRTVARARQDGLPFMFWGGRVWIHVPGAKKWLEGRIRRLNPKRAA